VKILLVILLGFGALNVFADDEDFCSEALVEKFQVTTLDHTDYLVARLLEFENKVVTQVVRATPNGHGPQVHFYFIDQKIVSRVPETTTLNGTWCRVPRNP